MPKANSDGRDGREVLPDEAEHQAVEVEALWLLADEGPDRRAGYQAILRCCRRCLCCHHIPWRPETTRLCRGAYDWGQGGGPPAPC